MKIKNIILMLVIFFTVPWYALLAGSSMFMILFISTLQFNMFLASLLVVLLCILMIVCSIKFLRGLYDE